MEAPEKYPTHTGIATVFVIVKIVLGDSIVEISGVQLSVTHKRHFPIADVFISLLALTVLLSSLSGCSQELTYKSCIVDITIWGQVTHSQLFSAV